jgi:DNA-binding transcriptional LysR family regulator
MAQPLPISLLRAFEAAGRTGSFRAAAAELNLTPSAISHAIRKLETHLGVVLFERSAQGSALSPEGVALLDHVRRGFEEIRGGLEMISARGPSLLRLHCAPSFATQWLSPRLGRYLGDNPMIDVRLAANTQHVRFDRDEFDAYIVYGEIRPLGAVVIGLGEETVTPLCAPALAGRIASIHDLTQCPLIQSEAKRVRWPDWFRANGRRAPLSAGARFDRSFLAIAAAVDGLGVALESTRLAEREIASGALTAPLAGHARDIRYVGHYLVYSEALRHRRSIRSFTSWLLGELGLAPPAA